MPDTNQTNKTQDEEMKTAVEKNWEPEDVPQLTVDVYKKNQKIYVVSTVAGVNSANLDISINDNTLSIKGVRVKPYNNTDNEVLLEECFWGSFSREITINETLNVDEIKANLKNGVLTIEVPIYKITAQRKISVIEG
jgi:HSP20 family protein